MFINNITYIRKICILKNNYTRLGGFYEFQKGNIKFG